MITKFIGVWTLAVLCGVGLAPAARADGVDTFTYQSNGNTFVWQLPSSPTPGGGDISPGYSFTLYNISVSENNAAPVSGTFDFYTLLSSGGFDLEIGNDFAIDAVGPPAVFTELVSAPTFLTGKFQFTDYGTGASGSPGKLTITSNVPEPSIVGLLAMGILLLALVWQAKEQTAFRFKAERDGFC
jgi:hypothetical protein